MSVHSELEPVYILGDFNLQSQKKGWKLIRNLGCGFGPSVENSFGTTDLQKIKADCDSRTVELDVISDSQVRTTQVRDAIHTHPQTGDELWLNHVVFWHTSSLPKPYFDYVLLSK